MKSGLLCIDKPAGITSFDVIRMARKKLHIQKIGHAGTLDPFATGLLLLAVNNGTKALSHLLTSAKTYRTKIVFGITSDTLDTEGEIQIQHEKCTIQKDTLSEILTCFVGKISQIPPEYSALKIRGKRACDRMRAGEEIQMKPRETEVFSAELLDISQKSFCDIFGSEKAERYKNNRKKFFIADVRIHVQTGFYVRSFARDLAQKLKTVGMCLTLQRESIGNFSLENAISLDDISLKRMFPLQKEHFSLPTISFSEEQKDDFCHGKKIPFSHQKKGEYAVFYKKDWIGFAEQKEDAFFPKKVVLGL